MEPRLKTSKKWTSFPKEYLQQIEAVFHENFAQFLPEGKLIIEGRIYPEEILFRAGYLEAGRLTQANFEFSAHYTAEDGHALRQIHLCVDAAGSLLLEYLTEEKKDEYPLLWKEITFTDELVYFKFSTENSDLENEANKLLGLDPDVMVAEENDSEDALARAVIDEELSPEADEDWAEDLEDESWEDEGGEDDSGSSTPPRGQLH